jgi:hypothetical protein
MEAEPVSNAGLSHPEAEYFGEFENPGYGKLCFSKVGDDFKVSWRGDEFTAKHYHYDVFKVESVLEDVNWWCLPLQFKADPYSGELNTIAFELDPFNSPIIFKRVQE